MYIACQYVCFAFPLLRRQPRSCRRPSAQTYLRSTGTRALLALAQPLNTGHACLFKPGPVRCLKCSLAYDNLTLFRLACFGKCSSYARNMLQGLSFSAKHMFQASLELILNRNKEPQGYLPCSIIVLVAYVGSLSSAHHSQPYRNVHFAACQSSRRPSMKPFCLGVA